MPDSRAFSAVSAHSPSSCSAIGIVVFRQMIPILSDDPQLFEPVNILQVLKDASIMG